MSQLCFSYLTSKMNSVTKYTYRVSDVEQGILKQTKETSDAHGTYFLRRGIARSDKTQAVNMLGRVCVLSHSAVSDSATPRTVAH